MPMNRSKMNMQMTRGDKMDDEKKGKKKSYAKGGKVRGSGCAMKGTRKAKMR